MSARHCLPRDFNSFYCFFCRSKPIEANLKSETFEWDNFECFARERAPQKQVKDDTIYEKIRRDEEVWNFIANKNLSKWLKSQPNKSYFKERVCMAISTQMIELKPGERHQASRLV